MPKYRLCHPETKKVETHWCSIADYEALKEEGYIQVYESGSNIISGRDHSGQGGGHGTSDGWKDVLRRIKSNNPKSTIDV